MSRILSLRLIHAMHALTSMAFNRLGVPPASTDLWSFAPRAQSGPLQRGLSPRKDYHAQQELCPPMSNVGL